MKQHKGYFAIAAIIAFFACVNILFQFVTPDEIVHRIGTTNTYAAVFLLGVIGGVSSFTGTAFFTTLAAFGAGGAHPLLLGLFGGAGLFISDSIFYLIASYGRESIPPKWERRIEWATRRVTEWPEWSVLLFVFAYVGLTPLPNDLLMLGLVVAKVRYAKIAPVLAIGSITVASIAARIGMTLW